MRVIFAVAMVAATLVVQGQIALAQGKPDKKPDPKVAEPVNEVLGKPVEYWIKEINHSDPGKSLVAVEAILKFNVDKADLALPTIIARLGQYPPPPFSSVLPLDPSLRVSFIRAIGAILAEKPKTTHFQEGVKRLKASLKDPQFPVRIRALESLALLGYQATEATNEIIALTREKESWELRRAALVALASVAFEPKVGLKKEVSEELYKAAEKDLCFQVRLASIDALRSHLEPNNTQAKLEFEKRIDVLSGTDPDPMVLLMANWAVMVVKDAVVAKNVKQVSVLMEHSDPTVRIRAIEIAIKIGNAKLDSAFIPAMIRRLDDKEPSVRLGAIQGLGASGKLAKSALELLKGLLDDKELTIQGAAIMALGSMGSVAGPTVGVIVTKMANPDLELVAINALGSMGEAAAAAVDPLIEKLSDTNLNIRRAAMIALGKIGDKKALAPLLKLASDPNPFVQVMAIEAIGLMGPKAGDAVKILISRLYDKDQSVRETVIWALGVIHAREAAVPLSNQLGDTNGNIVRRSLLALAEMGPEASAAVPAINKQLDSKDNEIVMLSIRALALIGPSGKNSSVPALQKFAENMSHPEYLRMFAIQAMDVHILEKDKKKDGK